MSSRLVNWGINITGGSTIIINSTQPSTFTNITAANIVGTSISGSNLLMSNITTTSLNMSSNVISNVANPVSLTDAASKLYIDKLQYTRGTTSNILDSGVSSNNNWTKGSTSGSNTLSFTSGYIQLSNPTGGSPNFFPTSTQLNRGSYGRNKLVKIDAVGVTGAPQIHIRYNNISDIYISYFDALGFNISTWNGTTLTALVSTTYSPYSTGFTYTHCVKSYENLAYSHLIYNSKVIAALHSVTSGYNSRTYTANGLGNSSAAQLYDNFETRDLDNLTNFVMFGDSNTLGVGITGGDEWSNQIMYDLKDQNVAVYNAGIGGNQASDLINRISTVYGHFVNLARNICVVLIGTNDVSIGVTLATIEANITTVVSGLKANNFEVWLCTYPARTDNVTYNITIRQLNDWIRANTAGASRIIDLYTTFTDPSNDDAVLSGYLQVDGLHISTTGATVVKNILVANLYDDYTYVKKSGTSNLNIVNITTSNLLANSRLSIGGTQPSFNSNTLGSLFITGSASASNGTGIVINNTTDIYPNYQSLALGHNGFYQYYDCYFDGSAVRQSSSTPSFYHSKESGQLRWYTNGVSSAGNIVTNTVSMTINSAGNVGINTAIPKYVLDIGQNAFNKTLAVYSDTSAFYGFGANNLALNYQVDNSASHVFYVGSTTGQSAAALGTEVARINAAGISAANLVLTTGRISSRLDIGGTQPSFSSNTIGQLFITGAASTVNGPHIVMNTSTDTFPTVQLLNYGHDNIAFNFDGYFDGSWRASNTTGTFQIYKVGGQLQFNYANGSAGSSLTSISTGMVLNAIGNIGIGQVNPTARLYVSGTETSSHGNSAAIAMSNLASTTGNTWFLRTGAPGTFTPSAGFSIADNSGYKMVFSSTGNIGIGTLAPESALHVVGSRASAPTTKGIHMGEFGTNDYAIEICAANTSASSYIDFTAPSIDFKGRILYSLNNNTMGFFTNTTQYMTLGSTGNLAVTGALSKGSGTFDIPHPLKGDSNERLVHSFIEGPRCDLIYRGSKALVNGTITINLDTECVESSECSMTDGTFVSLCTNNQYYLQNNSSFDRVRGSITGNILTIICENNSSNDIINWMVIGERKDTIVKQWERTNTTGNLITEYTRII
jgi:lysophospholipase L1-like esterase